MTSGQPCLKRLLGCQQEKDLFRLFVRAEKQVEERLAVVFHKDAIADISPMQGAEALHDPVDQFMILRRVLCFDSITILSGGHLFFSPLVKIGTRSTIAVSISRATRSHAVSSIMSCPP